MAVIRKRYIPDIFSFYLRIPFFRVQIELFTRNEYSMSFNILRFRIDAFKYHTEFDLRISERRLFDEYRTINKKEI